MRRGIYAFLLAAFAAAAQQAPADKEAALSVELARDVRQRTTALDNARVRAYVETLGSRLSATLPERHIPFTFAEIADDAGGRTREPISLPGGFLFVSAHLFLSAQDEAEFAGMLAHAMAHLAAGHGALKWPAGQPDSIPLIFMGGWLGPTGDDDVLIPAGFREVRKQRELEADALAIRMMANAGFDPQALVRYIGRMQPESMPRPGRSALPPREARIAAMEKAIRELPSKAYGTRGGFEPVQNEVRRLLEVPEPRPPHLKR